MEMSACPGCGLELPQSENGATHPYIGASAACWALYGQVLVQERLYTGHIAHPLHAVDTYAVQHPGVPGQRSMRSVATHLLAIYAALEHGANSAQILEVRRAVHVVHNDLVWLEPPSNRGADLTVRDILAAQDALAHADLTLAWAMQQWQVWAPHHAQIEAWACLMQTRTHSWLAFG